MRAPLLLLLLASLTSAADSVSPERIRAHVRFLSHDLLEGRAPGHRGGELAAEYIATQFALAGAKPAGDNGTYFQIVPLIGVQTQSSAKLTFAAGDQVLDLTWIEDFVGATALQQEEVSISGQAVFVGHGIVAPEYEWNDYAGVDAKGKVVILFTNEPASEPKTFFDGEALTYYGRWTYKYEEALRQGAAAAILIHTDATAGYGWEVVRNSWGREAIQIEREEGAPALSFAGWLTEDAGKRLLALTGHSVEDLLGRAGRRGFRAVPLGLSVTGVAPSKIRRVETRNVAAVVPGLNPDRRSEAVIFSAHWDHLGVGPEVDGDAIYNGAVDNATGTAILLELARAWASIESRPARSALFLAVTAEESGLHGSRYYTEHPFFPPGKTAAALNFDSYLPLGLPTGIVVTGAERTTIWPLVSDAARRHRLTIERASSPGQGGYFRSDHFSFAKAGIPAFSISMAREIAGKEEGWIDEKWKESGRRYHRPSDEFRQEWEFSGLALIGEYGLLLGRMVADLDKLPSWKAGDALLEARQANQR